MIFIELLNSAALLGEVKELIKESLEYKNQILYHEPGLFALLAPVDIVGSDVFEQAGTPARHRRESAATLSAVAWA